MANKPAAKVVGIQNRSVLYEAPPAALVPEGVAAFGFIAFVMPAFLSSFQISKIDANGSCRTSKAK